MNLSIPSSLGPWDSQCPTLCCSDFPTERNDVILRQNIFTDFLNLTLLDPTFQQIREQAYNRKDYFHFLAMYSMCVEYDSFEILIADDHYLYRVDTTTFFLLSNAMLDQAGINEQIGDYIPKAVLQKHVEHIAYERSWQDHVFHKQLEKLIQIHGEDCRQPYLETFSLIQGIPADYIDNFLNTLCYFYPDFIGDYFKRFITALQKESAVFLKEETGQAV